MVLRSMALSDQRIGYVSETGLQYLHRSSVAKQGRITAARIICDVHMADGTPFAGCPRVNLKRVLAEAKTLGYTMNVGTECEFFLLNG